MQLTRENILDTLTIGDIMYVANPQGVLGSRPQEYIFCGIIGNMIIFVDADKDSKEFIKHPITGLTFMQQLSFGAFTTEEEACRKLIENYRILADFIEKNLEKQSLRFGIDFNNGSS